jgi:hypothetical protein
MSNVNVRPLKSNVIVKSAFFSSSLSLPTLSIHVGIKPCEHTRSPRCGASHSLSDRHCRQDFAAAHHPSPQHRERERERHGESGTAASHVTEAASPSTSACKCSPRRPLLSPHSHEPCHRATSAIEPHLTQNSNAPMPSQAAGCARSHVAASSFALSGQSSIEALATIE